MVRRPWCTVFRYTLVADGNGIRICMGEEFWLIVHIWVLHDAHTRIDSVYISIWTCFFTMTDECFKIGCVAYLEVYINSVHTSFSTFVFNSQVP
jgi:hypothetical protein